MAGSLPLRGAPRRSDDEDDEPDPDPPVATGRPRGRARQRADTGDEDAGDPQSRYAGFHATAGDDHAVVANVRVWASAHLKALAVVLVLALVGAATWTMRSRATELPLAVMASVSAMPASPSPTPTPVIQVHIIGSVARPGVVVLPQGGRVADVIEAAGGLTKDADPGELNLAAVVTDGAQVRIGDSAHPSGEVVGAGSPSITGEGGGSEIDLNAATAAQLDQLPGVGPVTAAAILAWREEHGRFTRVEELQEVDGIGPKTYAQIAPHVRV